MAEFGCQRGSSCFNTLQWAWDQVAVVLAKDSSQFEATAAWTYAKQVTESQTTTEEQLEKLLTGMQKIGAWRLTPDYGRVSVGPKDGGRMVVDCRSNM